MRYGSVRVDLAKIGNQIPWVRGGVKRKTPRVAGTFTLPIGAHSTPGGKGCQDEKVCRLLAHDVSAATGSLPATTNLLADDRRLVDKRFKAFVRMAGNPKMDAFRAKYGWLDRGIYVAHAVPASVLLQCATKEDFLTPARRRKYDAVVSEPKNLKFYEAPHALHAERSGTGWRLLVKVLNWKTPDATSIARLPELAQPADRK